MNAPAAAPALSTGVPSLDDPRRHAFMVESVGAASLGGYLVGLGAITAMPGVVGLLLDRPVDPPFVPAILWLLQVPAYLWFRHAVLTRDGEAFRRSWVACTILLGLWLNALAWTTATELVAVTAVLLVGLQSAFIVMDSQTFHDDEGALALNLLPLVVFDAGLFLYDAVGGEGLVHAARTTPETAITWVLLQGLTAGLAATLLTVVGRLARERDRNLQMEQESARQLAVIDAEREVLRRTCDFMLGGLEAGRFSHDVAGPLMVLEAGLDELGRRLPEDERATLEPIVTDLAAATHDLADMTTFMVRGLRGQHRPAAVPVETLIDRTAAFLGPLLRGHELAPPRVDRVLEPAEVRAEPLHPTALANILANGALQAPDAPLTIRGRVAGDHYELVLRDYGSDGSERLVALRRVRKALSLAAPDGDRDARYRGQGMGLLLAKVVVTRQGGELEARVPEQGPGLELVVRLRLGEPTDPDLSLPASPGRH